MAQTVNYRQAARQAALRHGLDPNIFERQINQESGFNPSARSPAGAQGIAQFMPATARGMGVNPLNPIQALDGAARLMASYVHRYGSYASALAAYNAGPGAVGKPLPAETQNYIRVILGNASGRSSSAGPETGATTRTIPAVSRAGERRSLLLNYLLNGGKDTSGQGLLNTVVKIKQTPDTPARTAPAGGGALSTSSGAPTGLQPRFERVDQGQDLRFSPGQTLPALGNGIVKTVASDPNGFGPAYPVIHFTSGPLAGKDIYYGHTIAMVRPGQRVSAGQPVGRTSSKGGIGNATTPGWAEIGLWPPGNMSNGAKIAGVLRQVFR